MPYVGEARRKPLSSAWASRGSWRKFVGCCRERILDEPAVAGHDAFEKAVAVEVFALDKALVKVWRVAALL